MSQKSQPSLDSEDDSHKCLKSSVVKQKIYNINMAFIEAHKSQSLCLALLELSSPDISSLGIFLSGVKR
jgi:hypothetical protein